MLNWKETEKHRGRKRKLYRVRKKGLRGEDKSMYKERNGKAKEKQRPQRKMLLISRSGGPSGKLNIHVLGSLPYRETQIPILYIQMRKFLYRLLVSCRRNPRKSSSSLFVVLETPIISWTSSVSSSRGPSNFLQKLSISWPADPGGACRVAGSLRRRAR